MKLILAVAVLAAGLSGCSNWQSDAQIRRQLVGTWVADWDPSKIIEHKADGTCVSKFTVNLTNSLTFVGVWQVKQGMIISSITNAAASGEPFGVESNKVVSIDVQRLVVLSAYGKTNELVFHKQ
ncbi:hypothetical protein GC207_05810 [bacterium]|nr:hypothetical protein [bacterium]